MNGNTILVDVREDIRNGREPFSKIMTAVGGLHSGQELLLVAPFEPIPLFDVLGKQGFQHTAQRQDSGDWEVRFRRNELAPEAQKPANGNNRRVEAPATVLTEIINVDARGLEPPLPLIKILETVSSLPATAELHARTDRRPIHLYAQLEDRGFGARTEEQSDGSFLTHIYRC